MDEDKIEEIKQQWIRDQFQLKKHLVTNDGADWLTSACDKGNAFQQLHYVGGVDISFVKDDNIHACAAFVVLSHPELKVAYEDYQFVHLTLPYIPEFLAFREVSFLQDLICKLKRNKSEFVPQVIFVDGNGILHPRGFGLASHLGVVTEICTIGIGKTLFHVDGLEKNSDHQNKISQLAKAGDSFFLVGNSGLILGAALRSTDTSRNPIYVSVGHQISLETALKLTSLCCRHRIPEPIRQADMRSREFLRLHSEKLLKTCCAKEFGEEASSMETTSNSQKLAEESVWNSWCTLL